MAIHMAIRERMRLQILLIIKCVFPRLFIEIFSIGPLLSLPLEHRTFLCTLIPSVIVALLSHFN